MTEIVYNREGPGRHSCNRAIEWIMSVVMLGEAFILIYSPNSLHLSAFSALANLITQEWILPFFIIFGMTRMFALWANGHFPWGCWVRVACAVGGCVLWYLFWSSLLAESLERGSLSPGLPVYMGYIAGEVVSVIRAIFDDRPS